MRWVAVALMVVAGSALAHDRWADGTAVPAWIKSACCGPDDAHQLDPSQVSEDGDFYVIQSEGHTLRVKKDRALPSQDGKYWIFYSPYQSDPAIYCLFIPEAS